MNFSLGSEIDLIGGGTPKTTEPTYWGGNIPWLSVVDFSGGSRWVSTTQKSITELGLENSSTKLLQPGDIIISARGTVGEIAQLTREMAFNQSCYGIRAKDNLDQDFLYYLVKQKINELKSQAHGGVFSTITKETFDRIKVEYPEKNAQREIAKILGDLDRKIELNRKMNETLEQIGQTLFKKYFVDNPEREGWEKKTLADISKIVMGQSPESKYYNTEEKGLAFHQGVTNFGLLFPTHKVYSTSGDRIAEEGDILISVRAPVGRLNIANRKLILGRGVSGIKHKSNKQFYLFYLLKSIFAVEDSIGSGSVFNAVTRKELEGVKFVYNESTVDIFDTLIAPISLLVSKNSIEILSLSKSRDLLLPKLISGKIKV